MINSKHKDLYMKKIYTLAALAAMTMLGTSCNSEWEDEQYEHYISFSSQLDSKGVTNIYVPYSRHDAEGNYAEGGEGRSNYQLPILVSWCWPVVRLTPVQPSVRRFSSAWFTVRPRSSRYFLT